MIKRWNRCVGRSMVGLLGIAAALGCEHAGLRVEHPSLPTPAKAKNDLVQAESLGATRMTDGRGLVAVRITNLTGSPIDVGGDQGANLPVKQGGKAWLAYRGDEDLRRFAKTELSVEVKNGEASVRVNVPEEGVRPLPEGESRILLVGFEAPVEARDVSIDLSPVVASRGIHTPTGELRTLYLTVPILDAQTFREQARQLINNTKFGFQLTSDDL